MPQVAQARNMSIGVECVTFEILGLYGKKPIVSVTYENELISIKNSSPYIKCVLHFSCVVHGPINGRFMGSAVNGFLSLCKVYTNPYNSNVTQQCRCSPMLMFRAWPTCDCALLAS